MTLHDIGKREAAFPKLLFYVRRWLEDVKNEGIARYEHTPAQRFAPMSVQLEPSPYRPMTVGFQ